MLCEKCWHFRKKYRFCDFLGRDIEAGEIETPADCCWFDFDERKEKEEEDGI